MDRDERVEEHCFNREEPCPHMPVRLHGCERRIRETEKADPAQEDVESVGVFPGHGNSEGDGRNAPSDVERADGVFVAHGAGFFALKVEQRENCGNRAGRQYYFCAGKRRGGTGRGAITRAITPFPCIVLA